MNRMAVTVRGAWGLAVLSWIAALAGWKTSTPFTEIASTAPSWRRQLDASLPTDTVALRTAVSTFRDQNPFRWDHRASANRFNPWQPLVAPPPPPALPPKPTLLLTGLLGGPPWTAIIEGIPGRESGVLLQVGQAQGGVTLVRLKGDTAVLAGFDTTWRLTPRQAWR